MASIEDILVSRLAEIKTEMKELAVERNKVRAALQAVKGLAAQETGQEAGDLTFKEKIKLALKEPRFRGGGATANEILEWCNLAWPDQPIMRSSLSPQLSRLKAEGAINLIGKSWLLAEDDKEKGSDEQTPEPSQSIFGEDDDPLA